MTTAVLSLLTLILGFYLGQQQALGKFDEDDAVPEVPKPFYGVVRSFIAEGDCTLSIVAELDIVMQAEQEVLFYFSSAKEERFDETIVASGKEAITRPVCMNVMSEVSKGDKVEFCWESNFPLTAVRSSLSSAVL